MKRIVYTIKKESKQEGIGCELMASKYSADDLEIISFDYDLLEQVDISRKGFEENLGKAAHQARDFTREMVTNDLPDEMIFLVRLGCSYDGNPLRDGEYTYPEDYSERERLCSNLSQIVDLLWRDGRVPEWINVEVHDADKNHTHIELTCCGRFSSDKKRMYHLQEGKAPFHVLGPSLPPEYTFGEKQDKFDLHWRKKKIGWFKLLLSPFKKL